MPAVAADCEELAEYLSIVGRIPADYYHAGMPTPQRILVQNAWQRGETRVVCATIAYGAFMGAAVQARRRDLLATCDMRWTPVHHSSVCAFAGMGIDCPHVRFVVHMCLSKSVEGYFQEAGRAGRDGAPAHCLLLYHPNDVQRVQRLQRMKGSGGASGGGGRAGLVSSEGDRKLADMKRYCELATLAPEAEDDGSAAAGVGGAKRRRSAAFGAAASAASPAWSSSCRRAVLVSYFGQKGFDPAMHCDGSCGTCFARITAGRASAPSTPSVQALRSTSPRVLDWLAEAEPVTGDTMASLLESVAKARRKSVAGTGSDAGMDGSGGPYASGGALGSRIGPSLSPGDDSAGYAARRRSRASAAYEREADMEEELHGGGDGDGDGEQAEDAWDGSDGEDAAAANGSGPLADEDGSGGMWHEGYLSDGDEDSAHGGGEYDGHRTSIGRIMQGRPAGPRPTGSSCRPPAEPVSRGRVHRADGSGSSHHGGGRPRSGSSASRRAPRARESTAGGGDGSAAGSPKQKRKWTAKQIRFFKSRARGGRRGR